LLDFEILHSRHPWDDDISFLGKEPDYYFLPGEFIQWKLPYGDVCIGRILSVAHTTLSVSRWNNVPNDGETEDFNLPPVLADTQVVHVIRKPKISSAVYVFNSPDISSFKVRYVYGMQHMYRTEDQYDLNVPPQSLRCIIFNCLTKISQELQRVLCNRRENQEMCSSFSVDISSLTWQYIVENLNVDVASKEKVCTYSVPCGQDLSTNRVKARFPCYLLRVDNMETISQIVAMFGVSAVVGVRKRPPAVIKKLHAAVVANCGGTQMLDVINIVDVSLNDNLPPITKVTFNAKGRKGIDFIYFPQQHSLKMSVRYKQYVVGEAMDKLYALGIALPREAAPLTDDELEAMIRG
jgi:hypothetical protein